MLFAVAAGLLSTLAACTTTADLTAPEIPNSPWKTQTFITVDPAVRVTVTALDPQPRPKQVQVSGAVLGDGALYFGVTPWRRSLTGRKAVGVVIESGRVRSAPVPPYWAVVLQQDGRWQMVAQRDLEISLEAGDFSDIYLAGRGTVLGNIHLAVGGFYPLIAHGRVVAGAFPGRDIRAPRVAIGGVAGDDPRLVIVTAGTGRGMEGVAGDGGETRGGLTTAELARLLQRYELDWALNLDGGRSAYLRFPDGSVWPRDVWFRRRGPVVLRIQPSETSPTLRKVVE